MDAVLTDFTARPAAASQRWGSDPTLARPWGAPQGAEVRSARPLSSPTFEPQRSRTASVLAVLAVHLGLAVGLWQGWTRSPKPPTPVLVPVRWIAPPEPRLPATPADLVKPARDSQPAPVPRVDEPLATPATTAAPRPAPERPLPVPEAAAPVSPTPAVAPAPAPTKVAINAPRYLVEPRLSMPLASRRLGEQGLVQLRLHIGTQGELIAATLARSSGFERLDAQALRDIRTARFAPLVEQGHPVEWECLALLSYELTR